MEVEELESGASAPAIPIPEEVNQPSQQETLLEEVAVTAKFPSVDDLDRPFLFGSFTGDINEQPPEYQLINGPTCARRFIEFYARRLESGEDEDLQRRTFATHFGWDGEGFTKASASHWSIETLCAFHAVPFPNLEPEQVIPGYDEAKILEDADFLTMVELLTEPRPEDIGWDIRAYHPGLSVKALQTLLERESLYLQTLGRESELKPQDGDFITVLPMSRFIHNPFLSIFTGLRDIRSRGFAEKKMGQDQSLSGQHTAEKDEAKHEASSEELLHRLMETILVFYELKKQDHWLKSTAKRVELSFLVSYDNADLDTTGIHLACPSRDDGYLYLGRAGRFTHSHRFSNLPVVRYEAKTLSAITTIQDIPEPKKKGRNENSEGDKLLTVTRDVRVVHGWLLKLIKLWRAETGSEIHTTRRKFKPRPGAKVLLRLKDLDLVGELRWKLPALVRKSHQRAPWAKQIQTFCSTPHRDHKENWVYYAADKLLVHMEETGWMDAYRYDDLKVTEGKLGEGTIFQPRRQTKNNMPYRQPEKPSSDGDGKKPSGNLKAPKVSCVDHKVTAQQFSEMLACIMANINHREDPLLSNLDKDDGPSRTTPPSAIQASAQESRDTLILMEEQRKEFSRETLLEKRAFNTRFNDLVTKKRRIDPDVPKSRDQKDEGGQMHAMDQIEQEANKQDVLDLTSTSDYEDDLDYYSDKPPSDDTISRIEIEPNQAPQTNLDGSSTPTAVLPAIQAGSTTESQRISHPDQETFSIRIAHTYLSIARLFTPGEYLDNVIGRQHYQGDDPVYFQRTREFNLLTQSGRFDAAMALWGLLDHLCNEDAVLIERLKRRPASTKRDAPMTPDRTSELDRDDTRVDGRPRGMMNGNNLCYAISVIQSLAATGELSKLVTDYYPSSPEPKNPGKNITDPGVRQRVLKLIRAVQAVRLSIARHIITKPILIHFSQPFKIGKEGFHGFQMGPQHDADEFLILALNLFTVALGVEKMSIFHTKTKCVIKCNGKDCTKESSKEEILTRITLPLSNLDDTSTIDPNVVSKHDGSGTDHLPSQVGAGTALSSVDLNELLDKYTTPEDVPFEGFSPWRGVFTEKERVEELKKHNNVVPAKHLRHSCSNDRPDHWCGSTRATKTVEICSLPEILILQLGRTAWDRKKNAYVKVTRPVKFGLHLNLQTKLSPADPSCNYQLYAVIYHYGPDMTSGHYFAYVASHDGTTWWNCNDESVTPLLETTKIFANGSDPYILFYRKMDKGSADSNIPPAQIVPSLTERMEDSSHGSDAFEEEAS